jgi:hypothetical protein
MWLDWEADVLPGWTKTAQTAIRQITWQLKLLSLTCASPTSKIVISNKPKQNSTDWRNRLCPKLTLTRMQGLTVNNGMNQKRHWIFCMRLTGLADLVP